MPPKKPAKLEKPLTEVELELMNIVWSLGECTVKDVQNALPKERDLAYTSVATFMKILEQKGALKSTKEERAHIYRPIVSQAAYQNMSLDHIQENVFGGDPSSMVMRLIDNVQLSREEIEAIRSLLNQRLKP
jgi:predicted transcriptional regulator